VVTTATAQAAEAGPNVAAATGKEVSSSGTAATQGSVSQLFYGQGTKPSVSDSLASSVKYATAHRVSARMKVSDQQLSELVSSAGLEAPQHWGATQRDRDVGALVRTWAAGNSAPITLALQDRAAKLFGIPKDSLPPLGYAEGSSAQAAADALSAKYAAVIDSFLTSQWELTQEDLGNAGIKAVKLYRIFHFASDPEWVKGKSAGDIIDAPPQRPLASWGYIKSSAENAGTFTAGGHDVVAEAVVPRELLLSYPKTGFGSYNETEFVAIDAPGEWKIAKA
jgi:hypothetical protein